MPELSCFWVAIFQLLEPKAAFFIQRWVVFNLGIDTHVEFEELVDWVGFNSFLASPLLISYHQETKLFAPVAQVVDFDGVVAYFTEDVGKSVTDNSRTQVAD